MIMFENLSEKLENIFKKLKGRGILNEENVNAALKEIRMALLEADVNFKVVKDFIEDIRDAGNRQRSSRQHYSRPADSKNCS